MAYWVYAVSNNFGWANKICSNSCIWCEIKNFNRNPKRNIPGRLLLSFGHECQVLKSPRTKFGQLFLPLLTQSRFESCFCKQLVLDDQTLFQVLWLLKRSSPRDLGSIGLWASSEQEDVMTDCQRAGELPKYRFQFLSGKAKGFFFVQTGWCGWASSFFAVKLSALLGEFPKHNQVFFCWSLYGNSSHQTTCRPFRWHQLGDIFRETNFSLLKQLNVRVVVQQWQPFALHCPCSRDEAELVCGRSWARRCLSPKFLRGLVCRGGCHFLKYYQKFNKQFALSNICFKIADS